MQRERLMNDFSSALNNFQAAQRLAAEKEKQSVARVRAHSGFSQVSTNTTTSLHYISSVVHYIRHLVSLYCHHNDHTLSAYEEL